jgi:microcin C transport system permease protein
LLRRSRGRHRGGADTGAFAGEEVEQGLDHLAAHSLQLQHPRQRPGAAPSPPNGENWLGTDDTKRDVLARVIYGFRLSVTFTLIVTVRTSVIGIAPGAIQGYFGGWVTSLPAHHRDLERHAAALRDHHHGAIFQMNFWLLVFLMVLFGWMALWAWCARSSCARATSNTCARPGAGRVQHDHHVPPHAAQRDGGDADLLPFIVTGTIGSLASLDFLGFGLPSSAPSLGEMTLQAKKNLQAPWLGFTAFFTFAIMLSLLVFIFEGVRDAFDPRKTFAR